MDRITFQHPQIAEYINENFYAVKFDAQHAEEIVYQDKTYGNVKTGKKRYHELAVEFLRGKMSYPTVVFLDENMNLIQSIVGFKSPRQFEKIATYFGNNYYRKTPWSKYQKVFKPILTGND
jgi:thioredoxin-related protein